MAYRLDIDIFRLLKDMGIFQHIFELNYSKLYRKHKPNILKQLCPI